MAEEEKKEAVEADALADIVNEDGVVEDPSELFEEKMLGESVVSINDYPPYMPEEENEDILIKGRWLERGGSAWWISTAGTGKSIASVQAAYKWGFGLDFAGLEPRKPMLSWIIQSEDSPSRIAIDREDIVAELTERLPEVDWRDVGAKCVRFVKMTGKVGVDFLDELERLLSLARKVHADKRPTMPDIIIINPFMAFVGGPVTDGGYVTPFLRGGDINYRHTDGLQALLERHGVGALVFHHTPKPPTDSEVKAWLKSMFPEYQGAGSSDITNWGRSFVTMMKVPENRKMVCMVAGKNGSEIGWEEIGGSRRRYMAWSDATGVTGGRRHAWRELTDEEYESIVLPQKNAEEENITTIATRIAEQLKATPMRLSDIEKFYSKRREFPRYKVREAVKMIASSPTRFRITVIHKLVGQKWTDFLGLADDAREIANKAEQQAKVDKLIEDAKKAKGGDEGNGEGEGIEAPF